MRRRPCAVSRGVASRGGRLGAWSLLWSRKTWLRHDRSRWFLQRSLGQCSSAAPPTLRVQLLHERAGFWGRQMRLEDASASCTLVPNPARRLLESKEASLAQTDECLRQKEIKRGAFRHSFCDSEAGKKPAHASVTHVRLCRFIARLLSDDRCCNRTHGETAQQ